jgi:hypothetical protein
MGKEGINARRERERLHGEGDLSVCVIDRRVDIGISEGGGN